jgi:uncharacterized protein with PhoU and TrkA domain
MLGIERRRSDDGDNLTGPVGRSNLRLRATGTLQIAQRGPVLVTKGGAWLLESAEDLSVLVGKTVVAEGERHGFDRIRVDYVALAHKPA